jgi:RNA polymerase sigma-70 factor (ECF subfamily)
MPDWQEILSRDGPAVWQTAYRYLGNRADADECFQEAFLAAFEFSRRQEVQNWRALLKRLVAARAVDRLRRRRHQTGRREAPDWEALPDQAPTPPQVAEDAESSERLRAALAVLPPRQAEAFCLHCLEGFSYQEVAEQMTISVDAVGVLLHRARGRLRQLLGELSQEQRSTGCDRAVGSGPVRERKEPS